jgi:phage shock protein B
MNVSEAMMAPMVIFLTIVAPLWLILHYRSKKNSARVLATEDSETIEHLARLAEKMDARLAALEKILEADDPKWKEKAQ